MKKQGFLILKNGKFSINSKKTYSILLNQLHIDLLVKYKKYFKGKLLDAGCGEKPYSLLYNDLVDNSIGCDVETCVHDQKYVDVFATVDKLPFDNEQFDTILCTNVLEHVAKAGEGFKELSRCLSNGGVLILSTPFLYPLHEAPYDFYRYTTFGLRNQLEKNGFEIEKIIPLGGFGLMLVVYFNLFMTRLVKNGILIKINCGLQKLFYKVYKRVAFKRLCKGLGKINSIVSCGYFVIARKL